MSTSNAFALIQTLIVRALLALSLTLGLGASAWAQTSAARVMAVAGAAKAIDTQGKERLLEKGGDVFTGDRIVTGEGALVQLRLHDGGYISVRAGTDMVIDRFVYDEKDASKSNFLVSLVKGGFRSITGLIGRTNPNAYQIRAGTATLGIRGTDHEPMMIPPDVPALAKLGAPGLYDKVNEGETFIRNAGGLLALTRGQIGFSPLNTERPPQALRTIPDFYKIDVKVDARDPKDAGNGDGAARRQSSKTNDDGLLRPSTAARRAALLDQNLPAIDSSKTVVAPAATLVTPTTTLITPSSVTVAPTSAITVAPITTLVAPTTTLIAPTTTVVSPSTITLTPTTTLVSPTTTFIAPTTTIVSPSPTTVAPTTTFKPKLITTVPK